ncbi:hypothetical protein SPRG_15965, partial [Saprolegnia parasitica CBS 223.65]
MGDAMRKAIAAYDKRSGEQPYNALEFLKQLDRKKRLRLPPWAFKTFLAENSIVDFRLKEKEVAAVVAHFECQYDDGDAGVDYEQFARWLQPSLHYDVAELHDQLKHLFKKTKLKWRDIFKEMDADGNGIVTRLEFKEALRELGMPVTDAQLRCLMDEYDTDGDGKMAYDEFLRALGQDKDDSDGTET